MKKLLSEEKTGLRPVQISSKIFLFILLLSFETFSQIPINGFCKLDKNPVPEGYTNIFPHNYNKDSYTDLLLFNPLKSEVVLLTGKQNLEFSSKEYNFPFEPAQFKPVYDSSLQISYYAFTSRRSRLFGILSFNENGNPAIIKSIKLSSFPEVIDVTNTDNNTQNIFIVCGKSFDGISLFKLNGDKFEEEKIITGTAFVFAQFTHLNNDDLIDIITFNLFEKSFFFLINNGRNEFNVARKIRLEDEINYFQVFDINSDTFKDIIYADRNGIKILLGDPLYLFEKRIIIPTGFIPDNIAIADFNHDGMFDLAYSSKESGSVSVIFAKNPHLYHDEITYLQASNVTNLIPFFSKYVYGTVYLTYSGELGVISQLTSFKDDVALTIAIKPEEIISFDYNNNGITDFAFIDRNDNQLKFLLRNNMGIPATYFSLRLFGKLDKSIFFHKNNSEKIFYLFTPNEKLIEILYVDFSKFTFIRETIYAEGKIIDLTVSNSVESKPNIHLLFQKNNKLFYGIYTFSSIKYNFVTYPEISNSWIDALILNPFENLLAYWEKKYDKFHLIFHKLSATGNNKQIIYSLSTESDIKTSSARILLSEDLFIFSSIVEDKTKFRLLIFDQNLAFYSSKLSQKQISGLTKHNIKNVKYLSFGNDNLLYFYNEALKNFNRVFVNRYYNRFNVNRIFSNINIKNFLVTKLDTRNKHLIYIDSFDNLIKVKKIS